jgi:hypothetical protein
MSWDFNTFKVINTNLTIILNNGFRIKTSHHDLNLVVGYRRATQYLDKRMLNRKI